MYTDRALFESLRTTDHDAAITELFGRYSKLVYSIAFKVLRDSGAAEDVTQELFVLIWRRPPVISSQGESLTRWFMVAARNRAISALRVRRPEDPMDEAKITFSYDPMKQLESSFAIGLVMQAMEMLTIEQKVILESAFIDGLTHQEIAIKTGTALGTVKTRVRSALKVVSSACRKTAKVTQTTTITQSAAELSI